MDLGTAHATLGVGADTPIDEVRQRYRMRAQMVHPDRLGSRSDLQAEAQRAMSDLNAAWEVVSAADRDGTRHLDLAGPATDDRLADRRRFPVVGECDLCGASPAKEVRYRALTGLVILWRSRAMGCEMCRSCGRSMFREVQSDTLIKGWWGVIAVYANLVVLLMNFWSLKRHQRGLPAPNRRDPDVVTPFPPGLPLSKPVFKRPAPILASGVAAALMAFLFLTSSGSDTGSSTSHSGDPSSPSPDVVGTCLAADGSVADCNGPLAKFRLTRQVMSGSECASTQTVFGSTAGRIYCGELIP